MFTGLIEDVGELAARETVGKAGKLVVRTALPLAELSVGESIAINGACLTVESTDCSTGTITFHTLAETLRRTNLGTVPTGNRVNLERAMRLGERLGGHLVMGHVDTVARISRINTQADDYVVTVALPRSLRKLVIRKGSIAVNGISLTIAELRQDTFTVHLIPHTWDATNLRDAKPGDTVNLESDMVGKYILRQHEVAAAGSMSVSDLERAGFG